LRRAQSAVQEEESGDPSEERDPSPFCTQPECLLQNSDVGPEQLADIVIGALAGEDLSVLESDGKGINRRDVCTDCALRVVQGGAPYRTEDEQKSLVSAANWSRRRSRRRASR
jgi:hypothetical protein